MGRGLHSVRHCRAGQGALSMGGWWGIRTSADDDPVARAEPDFKANVLRQLDSLIASGLEREPAIRWLEDIMRMKRGTLIAFLER